MKLERRPWLLRSAILAIALLVAIVAWLSTRDDGKTQSASGVQATPARIFSPSELGSLVTGSGHQVYWAGPVPGTRLEGTASANGNVTIRYLTGGAEAGSPRGDFLTVGTYPLPNASAALERLAASPGASARHSADGTEVVTTKSAPRSAYFTSPEKSLQIEVYDPRPGRALALALSGRVRPVPVN